MQANATYAAYLRSPLWIAFLFAVSFGISIVVTTVLVDFIHGNPHRTIANTIAIMLTFPPLMGIIIIIGFFLVFAIPQCFQAMTTNVLTDTFGRRGRFGVLLALPTTTILAWYSYDYLTPNFGMLESLDGAPYQHGLTLLRFLAMLAIQIPITLFSLWYCSETFQRRSKRMFVLAALGLAIALGAILGYGMAKDQYQFL